MLTIIIFFVVIKFQLKISILATPVTNFTLWWFSWAELCYGKFTFQQILNHLRIDWMKSDGCSNWNCVVLFRFTLICNVKMDENKTINGQSISEQSGSTIIINWNGHDIKAKTKMDKIKESGKLCANEILSLSI